MITKLYPSILSCNVFDLKDNLNIVVQKNCNIIHIDMFDGIFVNNIGFGLAIIENIIDKYNYIKLDCHLATIDPEKWINILLKYKVYSISFHYESINSNEQCLKLINKIKDNNILCGIALKPKTAIKNILPYIDSCDFILLMTVEPGFGGQEFDYSVLNKISNLRKINKNIDIQVDGGINNETVNLVLNKGANIIVSGSYIFNGNNIENNINTLKKILNI